MRLSRWMVWVMVFFLMIPLWSTFGCAKPEEEPKEQEIQTRPAPPDTKVMTTPGAEEAVPVAAGTDCPPGHTRFDCPNSKCEDGQELADCAVCKGTGKSKTGNPCQSCAGTGKRYRFCRTCKGKGWICKKLPGL